MQKDIAFPFTEGGNEEAAAEAGELSDETRIGDSTWGELKEQAMGQNLQEQSWYDPLTSEEKDLLTRLIEAQEAQGDMLELQVQQNKEVHEEADASQMSDDEDERWPEDSTKMINCFVAENELIYLITMYTIFVLKENMELAKEIRFKQLYDAVDPNIKFITCCSQDISIENNNSYLVGCNAHNPEQDKSHAWLIKFSLVVGKEGDNVIGFLDFKKKLSL